MALILLRCFVISRFALLLSLSLVLSQFRCSPIELIPESITSRCERSKIVAITFFLAQTREASCSVSGDKNASFEWQTDEYRCAPVYITCVWVLCAGNIIILCIALRKGRVRELSVRVFASAARFPLRAIRARCLSLFVRQPPPNVSQYMLMPLNASLDHRGNNCSPPKTGRMAKSERRRETIFNNSLAD